MTERILFMNQQISSRQLGFLLFLLLTGSSFMYLPELSAGRDAWISGLLGSLFGVFILYLMIRLQTFYPGISIIRISEITLGKVARKLLSVLFLWVLLIDGILYLYDVLIFLNIIFPGLSTLLVSTLLILTAAYNLYKGINVSGRMGDLLIFVTLFFSIVGFLLATPLMNLHNLTPVFTNWKPIAGGILYAADWPYGEVLLLSLFLPFVSDLNEKRKTLYIWYFIAAILLVLKAVILVAILGPDLIHIIRFPLLEVFRRIAFSNLQRIELFFFVMWFIIGMATIVISFQALFLGIKDYFNLKEGSSLILPLGLLLIVLTAYMIPTDIDLFSFESQLLPFHNLPVYLLYPGILFLAAMLKQKRNSS